MQDTAALGTILGVWAHPDDDIFCSAGLMATAVRTGQRVVDVTATRGEGGSMDEERWPPASMGDVRTKELLRSLEILGVREHRFLEGPVDVDMQEHLDEAGAEQVRAIVQEMDPDTILTFGPEGMTGHQAHKDVSRWTTDAWSVVAKPTARLFYATQTPAFVEEVVPSLEQFDIFLPGTPPVTQPQDLGIDFSCDDEALDLKLRALEAHESQIEGLLEVFGEDGLLRFLRDEAFREATRDDG
ncbi:MAG TPA: PIG-L family deacetylase [Actinomycetota bacterium]|nr:PIG-L family deacetylase [Actinomycetota bacterium]